MTVHKSGDQKPNLVVVAAESPVGYRAKKKKLAISRKSCKIENIGTDLAQIEWFPLPGNVFQFESRKAGGLRTFRRRFQFLFVRLRTSQVRQTFQIRKQIKFKKNSPPLVKHQN